LNSPKKKLLMTAYLEVLPFPKSKKSIRDCIRSLVETLVTGHGIPRPSILQRLDISSTKYWKITIDETKEVNKHAIWDEDVLADTLNKLLVRCANYFEVTQKQIKVLPNDAIEDLFQETYLFHFWHVDHIRSAVFQAEHSFQDNDWHTVTVQYINSIDNAWIPEDIQSGTREEKLLSRNHSVYYVTTKSKNNNLTNFVIYMRDDLKLEERKVLFCSYSTNLRKHIVPVAGIGILERVKNRMEAVNKIEAKYVPPEVYNRLFQRRNSLKLDERQGFTDIKTLPNLKEIRVLTRLKGKYVGFHLDNDNSAIRTITMEISVSGKAKILDGQHEGGLPGYFSIPIESLLHGTFDHNIENAINRLHVALENNLKEGMYLIGIYGGYSSPTSKPFAGTIKFVKLDVQSKSMQEKLNSIAQRTFKSNKQDDPKFQDVLRHFEIIEFFQKYGDEYINNLGQCVLGVAKENLIRGIDLNLAYTGPVGDFFVYALSTDLKKIVRYPLSLDTFGDVRLKANSGKTISTYKGKAKRFNATSLLIVFDVVKEFDWKGVYLFFIGNNPNPNSLSSAEGISLRINETVVPQTKREFLIRSTISFSKATHIDIFPNSPEQKEIEKEMPGLYSYLFGKESNLIKVTNEVNISEKRYGKERYDKIYFYSACINFCNNNLEKFWYYLNLARNHGLNDSTLKAELSKLSNILNEDMSKALAEELNKTVSNKK